MDRNFTQLLRFEVLTAVVMKSSVFSLENQRRPRESGNWRIGFQRRSVSNNPTSLALVAAFFMPISCLPYPSTIKMEYIYCSETSVYFQWTTIIVQIIGYYKIIYRNCTPEG
jgi:hypothetical protein